MSGWTLQTVCNAALPVTHVSYNVGFCTGPIASTPCPVLGQAKTVQGVGTPAGVGCNMLHWYYPAPNSSPGNPRYNILSYWWRPGGGANPNYVPKRSIPRLPRPLPVLDPNNLPIAMPIPLPVPIPTALVPYRANDPIGSQRTNGDSRPVVPPRRPPPPREKEVKLRAIRGALAIVQAAGHAVTEGLDYLDAIHDALPGKFKAKPMFKGGQWYSASPQAKADAIWRNFDKIDWNDAIKNLAMNELLDRVLGRANGAADRALNQSPIGRITRGIAF